MEKILVTGATGHLGRQTVQALLKRTSSDNIVALARDPSGATDLAGLGIEVRQGDYGNPASLHSAMRGIDRLMMVSTVMFTDTVAHHRNVIRAAKDAGVDHIVYTGIQRREGSGFSIDMVTETELATEAALHESGLAWTIMRNSLYLDSLPLIFGSTVLERGLKAPGGNGRAALGARRDFAEANAAVLTSNGHVGKIYTLGASSTASLDDAARSISEATGRNVSYEHVSRPAYVALRAVEGLPEPVASFLGQWAEAIAVGEFEAVTGDLERLIGRKPTDQHAMLQELYASSSL